MSLVQWKETQYKLLLTICLLKSSCRPKEIPGFHAKLSEREHLSDAFWAKKISCSFLSFAGHICHCQIVSLLLAPSFWLCMLAVFLLLLFLFRHDLMLHSSFLRWTVFLPLNFPAVNNDGPLISVSTSCYDATAYPLLHPHLPKEGGSLKPEQSVKMGRWMAIFHVIFARVLSSTGQTIFVVVLCFAFQSPEPVCFVKNWLRDC